MLTFLARLAPHPISNLGTKDQKSILPGFLVAESSAERVGFPVVWMLEGRVPELGTRLALWQRLFRFCKTPGLCRACLGPLLRRAGLEHLKWFGGKELWST